MSSLRERTLALAGLFQATMLVKKLAAEGNVDQQDFETCLQSILITDPESTEAVYGRVDKLHTGLQCLIEQFGGDGRRDVDLARYVISLLHLQGKLARNKEMMKILSEGVERARSQSEHFHLTHENVIANLAGVYSDTISRIPPKIMVSGEGEYLSNPAIADKIRALLLAGMRSAVLWRQLGGSRWQLLFQRKRFIEQAKHILKEEIPHLWH